MDHVDRDGAGFAVVADRLAPLGAGVADPEFRRGNGSLSEVLVHCGESNTWHVHGRAHIGEIERFRLG